MTRPDVYAGAKLGADEAACLSLARTIWDSLTGPQQREMVRYRGAPRLPWDTHHTVVKRLRGRGLVAPFSKTLTGLGWLVREAGLHANAEAGR